jgi:hypothetical protein
MLEYPEIPAKLLSLYLKLFFFKEKRGELKKPF